MYCIYMYRTAGDYSLAFISTPSCFSSLVQGLRERERERERKREREGERGSTYVHVRTCVNIPYIIHTCIHMLIMCKLTHYTHIHMCISTYSSKCYVHTQHTHTHTHTHKSLPVHPVLHEPCPLGHQDHEQPTTTLYMTVLYIQVLIVLRVCSSIVTFLADFKMS